MNLGNMLFWFLVTVNPMLIGGMFFVLFFGRGTIGATIKARLSGSNTILVKFRPDGKAKFVSGKYEANMINLGKDQKYAVTPESMIKIDNLQLGYVNERVGATIPPGLLDDVSTLQDEDINSDLEMNQALPEIVKAKEELEQNGDKRKTETKQTIIRLGNILRSITNINNFFRYALNPSHMSEHISNELRKKLKKQNMNVLMWLVGGGVFIGLLGFVIWLLSGNVPSCGPIVDQAMRVCQAAPKAAVAGSIV